ncbi:hypothetical protein [Nocardia carnea]|uniref:hypothetical protein n=1 Tax=Nocardia carnea TaxID=37328 RepID=UPI002453C14F|nr:hypothetical protein [Nocardia carnea]
MLRTDQLAQVDRRPPVVETPLGTVEFSVVLGSEELSAGPDTSWRLANGSHLHRWRHRCATVDLLLGRVSLPPWDGEVPVHTWAAVWQVQGHGGLSGLSVSAELTTAPADAYAGPDSGECLAAVSAENDEYMVSIGGPDYELLEAQAAHGRLVPARWADLLPRDGELTAEYGVRYADPARITWKLPGLATAEMARLCIATAWCDRDDDRPAAWFAVDLPVDTAYQHLIADPA